MKKFILLSFFLPLFSFSNGKNLEEYGVYQYSLDNGLKLIVKEDKRSPVFISQLWYRVGASDEKQPYTGVSHMLEHMMFKGTQKLEPGEFSKIIAKNGGDENAFTSKDFTAYYQKMHKSKLELAIKMEADRMRNLTFSNRELETERQVVIEERRSRVEDNPNAKVYEKLQEISYSKEGAYHTPVIGFKDDLETYPLRVLRDWYEKYYSPNNATLVVVGDVNPERVYSLTKKYFGVYPHNPNIENISFRPSIPLSGNHEKISLKAKLPFVTMSFPVPSLVTANDKVEAYKLDMLSYVLDNGLSKYLVRNKQLATSVSVGYRLYDKYNTVFTIGFIPSKGVKPELIKELIKQQITELIEKPYLIEGEMQRTKAQIESSFVFEQDQISTQSYYLGMLSTIGLDIKEMFSYTDSMNKINAKDVAEVAMKYLDFSKSNSVELVPQDI